MWPLGQCESDSEMYFFLPNGTAQWKFLCKPCSWMVIPTEVVEFNGRFVFHPSGDEMPFSCLYLRSASFFGFLDAKNIF